ncbi:O2 contryphan Vc1-like [Babylonia areolata]|uniref:O2 contryphan Vc1-like n=1 Tax=Babylonia areolata TaxID=304850 RepID=UPI003FD12D55
MSKLFVVLFATLTLLVIAHGRAEAEEQQRRRAKRQSNMAEADGYPLDDVDLMQRIFRTPLKRQWCRAGMSYNPVLGSCTLSLAAMRGRGRNFRGV